MLFVLDGPEKAGKSTFAKYLQSISPWPCTIRHWGPIGGLHREYLYALQQDALKLNELVIWDRSYISEAVYSNLLQRNGQLGRDPWFGEYAYGRIVKTVGTELILIGPSRCALEHLRTPDDHKICVSRERQKFFEYAAKFNIDWRQNQHTTTYIQLLAEEKIAKLRLIHEALINRNGSRAIPPYYVGPQIPHILVLGLPKLKAEFHNYIYNISKYKSEYVELEKMSLEEIESGLIRYEVSRDSWTPFGSYFTREFGRALGPDGLNYAYSNIGICPIRVLLNAPIIIACGAEVQKYLALRANKLKGRVIPTPHPSYTFRFGGKRKSVNEMTKLLMEIKKV